MYSFNPDNVVDLSTTPNPARAHISEVQPDIWVANQDMTEARAGLRHCPRRSWSEWLSFRRRNFPWR
jgi:hypothetical protein